MRILLVHNYYQSSSPSGEDIVFENERQMLIDAGVRVAAYTRSNDDIDDSNPLGVAGALRELFWSKPSYNEISLKISSFQPDIVHFHNTFPLISASGYQACRDNAIPVIQTLHNYRLLCPNGLFLRSGKPCEVCIGKTPYASVVHKCYRGSAAASAAVTAMLAVNRSRRIYSSFVNRYIALTDFAARRFEAGGLPKDRIVVKPNYLPASESFSYPEKDDHFIYVGRLSEEKGVRTLLSAWKGIGKTKLLIVGDGPLKDEVIGEIQRHNLNIDCLGFRSHDEVLRLVANARGQIVPSECYEGFPMVLLEAFASGTPVICSRIGALQEIVHDGSLGLLFDPGDPIQLRGAVDKIANSDLGEALGRSARLHFEKNYSRSINCDQLLTIYDDVLVELSGLR